MCVWMCKAPDVLGTCSVLSTLKRGPGGKQDSGACPGQTQMHRVTQGDHCATNIYAQTHTHTHTWDERQQQSATVLNRIREPAAVLLLLGSTSIPVCTGCDTAVQAEADWLTGHPTCPPHQNLNMIDNWLVTVIQG